MKDQKRRSGVLLHPTSLPGPHGIGELGNEAFAFVDFLERAGQTLWQVLPLGPTGYGDSPYASFSTFAGNPLLISLERLVESRDLVKADLRGAPRFGSSKVDFLSVQKWKMPLLNKAAATFIDTANDERRSDYRRFLREQGSWIDDFALFMAVKEYFQKKADAEGLEFVKGLGREIITLPALENDRWKAAVEPIVEKYLLQTAEKGLPGADFLKDAQTMIAEARAAQP